GRLGSLWPCCVAERVAEAWCGHPREERLRFAWLRGGPGGATGIASSSDDGKGVRGERRKPDSVETRTRRKYAWPKPRMIIYLGRRLPGASSDLPGSRDGSGRSVSGSRCEMHG